MEFFQYEGKIRCVIYDCDGVIFDSLEANRSFYGGFCSTLGRSALTEDELRYAHTHTVQEAIHHVFRDDPGLAKQAMELFSRTDPEEFIPYLKLEPNILSTLNILKERGMIRAICTSRSANMKHIMDRFNLWPYFELVVTALDVQNPKPHPESIERILQRFNLKRSEALFVGDSEIDEQAARAASIKFIAYKNREIKADGFIDDHRAILNLLPAGGKPGEEG